MKTPSFLLNFFISIVVTLASIEMMSFIYASYFEPNVRRPDYIWSGESGAFWGDINKDFGIWHYPNVKNHIHTKDCFTVSYTSNSYGARDVERVKRGAEERIIALGDSFIEGWGLSDKDRLTNILESILSKEVLNFGCSETFGPLQYYLLYKNLAKNFTHSMVLVCILPDNDFLDLDREHGKRVYNDRYRPYLSGSYPEYQIVYSKKFSEYSEYLNSFDDKIKRFFRSFSYSYNTHHYVKMLLNSMRSQKRMTVGRKNNQKIFSGYYDFTDVQFDMLKYCLEKIKEEAIGKTVVVVTLPRLNDFIRLEQGPPVLSSKLENLAKEKGFYYIDLLPIMHNADKNFTEYFFTCDRHWNIHGTETAAYSLAGPLQAILKDNCVAQKE